MQKNINCLNSLGNAVAHLGSDDFIDTLCESFANLEFVGHVLAIGFSNNNKPTCLYTNCKNEQAYSLEVDAYINGPYIFDPYYQASINGITDGAYRLKDIAPDNFKKTEFFRHYYKATNITDELSYTINLGDGNHIHLSVSPYDYRKKFTTSHLRFLNELSHLVIELVKKNKQLSSNATDEANSKPSPLHVTLQQALKNFGSILLTPREHDVLQLILHGHSNKAAAERLDISLATVKLHRKRIYQKLDISSQSELFYLFIDALSSVKDDDSGDPLQAYMNLQ